jgi:hypothetical protein
MAGVRLSSRVKAKTEVRLAYRLLVVGTSTVDTTVEISRVLHAKAKRDGQDVLTPLVTQVATEVVDKVGHK